MRSPIRSICVLALLAAASVAHAERSDPQHDGALAEATQTPTTWTSDYAEALERARSEGKWVLLNFTGSDWCVWCHRLRDEIFLQKPFLDYAREHLALVELDFPRQKKQSAELKKQNESLREKFGVTGYPTVILVDHEGRELGRSGYMQGGAKTFVRELKRYTAKARG